MLQFIAMICQLYLSEDHRWEEKELKRLPRARQWPHIHLLSFKVYFQIKISAKFIQSGIYFSLYLSKDLELFNAIVYKYQLTKQTI